MISIGKIVDSNKHLEIDLPYLIKSRMLIQANAGGGKSYCIRKLLEETHGKVQQIVLDLEGEFSTLREKFDYLLVGRDGDIPAEIRSAELLATKLLENNVSAIIDLSELKHHERILFVKRFLNSLVNSKRELWHPCLIIVDEAHQFCPEKGKSESTSSVIDLATRGRKRGYCAVLATQRLSKLHKDAAAECNNKLIGRTGLDIDMKRASEELGFTSKDQMRSLRTLEAGEFFSFGVALSTKQVTKVKIGKVKTTHPEAGTGKIVAPKPATDKIKKALAKFADLPLQAEEELRTKEDLKNKVRELKFELRKAGTLKYHKVPPSKEVLEKARQQGFKEAERSYKIATGKLEKLLIHKSKTIELAAKLLNSDMKRPYRKDDLVVIPVKAFDKQAKVEPMVIPTVEPQTEKPELEHGQLGRCAKTIYSLLYNNQFRDFSLGNVAMFTGYSPKSGGFKNAIARLNSLHLIKRSGRIVRANPDMLEEGRQLLGKDINLFEEFTVENWAQKLPKCASMIFSFLMNHQNSFDPETIAGETNYSPNSGGFKNAIARLNSLGLIKKDGGEIRINEEIFER